MRRKCWNRCCFMFCIARRMRSPIRGSSRRSRCSCWTRRGSSSRTRLSAITSFQAQKTWRKHNAAMILATQSIKELEESGMLQIVSESCPTKIFLANPEMDRELYREAFHLNDTELELIAGLVPPGQMLIRKAQSSKKVQLNVDSVIALDGDQQCPRQPEQARLLRALRHRRRACEGSPKTTRSGRARWPSPPPPTAKELSHESHTDLHRRARPGSPPTVSRSRRMRRRAPCSITRRTSSRSTPS